MCGGAGKVRASLQPPEGYYVRVRASNLEETDAEYNPNEYGEAEDRVNDLAKLGYELHSFAEDEFGTTWMMRWPLRWRCVL